jgi:hypothetical protein
MAGVVAYPHLEPIAGTRGRSAPTRRDRTMGTNRQQVEIVLADEDTGRIMDRATETLVTRGDESPREVVVRTPSFLDIPRWEDGAGDTPDGSPRELRAGPSADVFLRRHAFPGSPRV